MNQLAWITQARRWRACVSVFARQPHISSPLWKFEEFVRITAPDLFTDPNSISQEARAHREFAESLISWHLKPEQN